MIVPRREWRIRSIEAAELKEDVAVCWRLVSLSPVDVYGWQERSDQIAASCASESGRFEGVVDM